MPINTGDWRLIGKLGQGGFGEVQHWKNQLTNQEIGMRMLCVRASFHLNLYLYAYIYECMYI